MARGARAVVQVERLRDQVYELIRSDLKSGAFAPGQRLLEVELAEKYKVSRTPVREALFQLSRDGLLYGNERGYTAPTYTRRDALNRLEVKRLLDPQLVEHAVAEAEPAQLRALAKFHDQEKAAHAAVKVQAFNKANQQFRHLYRSMCKNALLVRCVTLVDDQFDMIRNRIHELAENRALSIGLNEALLKACVARDRVAGKKAVLDFLDWLKVYYEEHAAGD
jgi:DNA-binding GntR family transcriptional regulator